MINRCSGVLRNTVLSCLAGAILIGGAIYLALAKPRPEGLQANHFSTPETGPRPDVVARSYPVVTGFKNELAEDGVRQGEKLYPFVVGEIIRLEAAAENAIEYRWTANGKVVKDGDLEWSRQPSREFDLDAAGDIVFGVSVRGADTAVVSQVREKTIQVLPLYLESFEKAITEIEEDRRLTGDDISLEASVYEPFRAEEGFYLYRYLINGQPVKYPDEDQEWTTNSDLTYTLAAPGEYSFKVEVRRATESKPETSLTLAQTIVVADAVLLTFDATPEKNAPLGTSIDLEAFPESVYGKSECRFGVRKASAADFEWLKDEDGAEWGDSRRDWLPKEPGYYVVRGEIRGAGKESLDDVRELTYTITEGDAF